MNHLAVFLAGARIGYLHNDHGQITFSYDDEYAADQSHTPLSLAMPLGCRRYPASIVEPWIANLLSDHPTVRGRLAEKFGIPRNRPWELLLALGRDLPGAVQILAYDENPAAPGALLVWDEARIAEEIRRLHRDDAWVDPDPAVGHWSLAGAQGKFALAQTTSGWAEPTGSTPSTHIFKVGIHRLEQSDIAEFVTMRAAEKVGLHVAPCELEVFEDQPALVISRYDRIRNGCETTRLHQEDFCQLLGIPPQRKYQADGGPSWPACIQAVHEYLSGPFATAAISQLMRWQVFNLLTAATDGHAKNISLLLHRHQRALAPFYDMIAVSLLSEPHQITYRSRLAMSFGRTYDVRAWDTHRIDHAAAECGINPVELIGEIVRQSDLLDAAMNSAIDDAQKRLPQLDLSDMRRRWEAQYERIMRNRP